MNATTPKVIAAALFQSMLKFECFALPLIAHCESVFKDVSSCVNDDGVLLFLTVIDVVQGRAYSFDVSSGA
jgi:hypothetical protein